MHLLSYNAWMEHREFWDERIAFAGRAVSKKQDDSIQTHEIGYWSRIRAGDLSAYESVFRRYYADLYGYGLKLCSRPELVEDVIQELFVAIWEKKGDIEQIHSVKAYLLVSLRRRILKFLQKERYERQMIIEQGELPVIYFTAEDVIVKNEMHDQQIQELRVALNQLPARQKEVIYLRFYNGMSYEEIEEILSINYQSVRNHVYRAIKTLREIMREDLSRILFLLLAGVVCFFGI